MPYAACVCGLLAALFVMYRLAPVAARAAHLQENE